MLEDQGKDSWGLLSKIAAALGGGAVVAQLIKIWRSPKETREQTEQHYTEMFLKEIEALRDDIRQIQTDNDARTKEMRDDYETRLKAYSDRSHEASNRAAKLQGFLYRLGWELTDDGAIVRIRIERDTQE